MELKKKNGLEKNHLNKYTNSQTEILNGIRFFSGA